MDVLAKFVIENAENFTSPPKAKFSNFKDKFKIIKKGFRYYKDCERAEAFLLEHINHLLMINLITKHLNYFNFVS